jgi:molybdopterin converting factor small subunit
MPQATVRLPRLLEPAVGDVRKVSVTGNTFGEALGDLFAQHPTLRVHLLDEKGVLRPHVLCFHNGDENRALTDNPLKDGDEITFLQAVSGG